jgi:hypothetical protein
MHGTIRDDEEEKEEEMKWGKPIILGCKKWIYKILFLVMNAAGLFEFIIKLCRCTDAGIES